MGWLVALLAMGLTVGVVLATYAIVRKVLVDEDVAEDRELAASVVFRISALHGLILSLVFAQLVFEYQELRRESSGETAALADIYFDMDRYGLDDVETVQGTIREYVDAVIEVEWDSLASGQGLSAEAWSAWDVVYERILDLVPSTPREESLRDNMLRRIHEIASLRDARAGHGLFGLDGLFWMPAVAGVLAVAAGFHTFPPNRHTLFMLSLYGAFTGLVMFMIYGLSNPYTEPGVMRPISFERLLDVEFPD